VAVFVDARRRRTRQPAVIDGYFVIHHLHWTPPLILIVYIRRDRGIQAATEMLQFLDKRGEGVAHKSTAFKSSNVSPWPWPWSLKPKSKSLALALALTPQVLGLGLEALEYLHQ